MNDLVMDNVVDPILSTEHLIDSKRPWYNRIRPLGQHYVFSKDLLKFGAVAIYGASTCFMTLSKFKEFLKNNIKDYDKLTHQ